jgi:hypothetical protein
MILDLELKILISGQCTSYGKDKQPKRPVRYEQAAGYHSGHQLDHTARDAATLLKVTSKQAT